MNANLKKSIIFFCCFVLLLLLFAFSGAYDIVFGERVKEDKRLLYNFKSSCLETQINSIKIIKSKDQLDDYYNENYLQHGLEKIQEKQYYELENFLETKMQYKDSWFSKNYLAIMTIYEKQDFYIYRLNSYEYWFGKLKVVLYRDKSNRVNPNNDNCCRLVFLELPKKSMIISASVKVMDYL